MLLALVLTACGGGETVPETPEPVAEPDASVESAPEAPPEAPKVDVSPMTLDQLNVGTERTVLVLAKNADAEDAAFKAVVADYEAKSWPVAVVWAGCMPAVAEAVGGNEIWTAGLSFETADKANAFAKEQGITPLAVVADTIEPCGD